MLEMVDLHHYQYHLISPNFILWPYSLHAGAFHVHRVWLPPCLDLILLHSRRDGIPGNRALNPVLCQGPWASPSYVVGISPMAL